MSSLILMRRFAATMFVPPKKLEAYLAEGWTEVEVVEMSGEEPKPVPPVAVETPKAKALAKKSTRKSS
jgi:hypothetical protein